LRKLTQEDLPDLCEMLQDEDVMYAWEHTFSLQQVKEWLDKQLKRYENTGIGLLAVVDMKTNEIVGQIGLVWGDIEGREILELAYMLKKTQWGKGFAVEGSKACLDYAFNMMNVDKVYAPIRLENKASIKTAETLGFVMQGEYVKHYNGKDMLHLIYVMDKKDFNV